MYVAEELRVPVEKIQMVMGDTQLTPYERGIFGSRTTPEMNLQLRNDCCRTQSNNCLRRPSPAQGRRPSCGRPSSGGLAPPAGARLLFEKFVQGEFTEEQLVDAVLAR